MMIVYSWETKTLRTGSNCCVAFMDHSGRWILDLDRSIDMDTATKIFQRWHSAQTYAEPEVLAAALTDALNKEIYVMIGDRKIPLYYRGNLNRVGVEAAFNMLGEWDHGFSFRHDIPSDQMHYWTNKMADRQELAILR